MRRSSAMGLVCLLMLSLALLGCARGKFVASEASNKYHEPSCLWAEGIDADRRVWFDSAAEATEAGYEPCGRCEPAEE